MRRSRAVAWVRSADQRKSGIVRAAFAPWTCSIHVCRSVPRSRDWRYPEAGPRRHAKPMLVHQVSQKVWHHRPFPRSARRCAAAERVGKSARHRDRRVPGPAVTSSPETPSPAGRPVSRDNGLVDARRRVLDQIPRRKPGACHGVLRIKPGAVQSKTLPVAVQGRIGEGRQDRWQILRCSECQSEECARRAGRPDARWRASATIARRTGRGHGPVWWSRPAGQPACRPALKRCAPAGTRDRKPVKQRQP